MYVCPRRQHLSFTTASISGSTPACARARNIPPGLAPACLHSAPASGDARTTRARACAPRGVQLRSSSSMRMARHFRPTLSTLADRPPAALALPSGGTRGGRTTFGARPHPLPPHLSPGRSWRRRWRHWPGPRPRGSRPCPAAYGPAPRSSSPPSLSAERASACSRSASASRSCSLAAGSRAGRGTCVRRRAG